jgi:hypothetical protein
VAVSPLAEALLDAPLSRIAAALDALSPDDLGTLVREGFNPDAREVNEALVDAALARLIELADR